MFSTENKHRSEAPGAIIPTMLLVVKKISPHVVSHDHVDSENSTWPSQALRSEDPGSPVKIKE